MKQKRKGTQKHSRTYHYTIAKYLPEIIRDGEIKLATACCFSKREHAAWVSTNEFWEESANKSYLSGGKVYFGDREDTHRIGGGLARIEVNPKAAPLNWKQYVKKSKTSGSIRRGLESISKACGAMPSEWFASFKPIPKREWISIEIFDWEEQCWKPYYYDTDMIQENTENQSIKGDCYHNTYDAIVSGKMVDVRFEDYGFEADKIYLCHGSMKDGDGESPRFGHSWLLYGDEVIDLSDPKRIQILPMAVYYSWGSVEDVCIYDRVKAQAMLQKHGHKGPWN